MNDKKIAIIFHTTNEFYVEDALESFRRLRVPENFSVEVLPVQDEEKFHAYNRAMNHSDAKYKIYLDENISTLHKNILLKVIKLFQSDKKIGVIGLSGAIQLSTHGICLTSAKRVKQNQFRADKNVFEVESVDNFFLATQYDLTWREDLFKDNYFGFAAQCLEFKRKNLKTVVMLDETPQILIQQNQLKINRSARQIFLEEYKNIFPLVTVVIPTFNRPKYFQAALESVLNQTYRNFEIFISDNSTDNDTENLMQDYLKKYSNIKYFHHKNFSANDNWNFARQYNNPDAEFVNWLMDDDLFYPQKLEKMVEVYRNDPDISLVTSLRNKVDEFGNVIETISLSEDILRQFPKLNGAESMNLILRMIDNFIGELTTALIKKKFLRNNDLCWHGDEPGFFPLNDVLTWCQVLSHGDLYFFEQPLSAFRIHGGQTTHSAETLALCEIVWAKVISSAWDEKIFLQTEEDLKSCILRWLEIVAASLNKANRERYYNDLIATLEKTFVAMSQALINGYKIELPEVKYFEN